MVHFDNEHSQHYTVIEIIAADAVGLASQRNRAVTDIFEPGSTFKIVVTSAALQEGIVTPDTRIDCAAELPGQRYRLRDTRENGVLTVRKPCGSR